ncbi:hypothetical protein [Nocardia inohanensis]|uniref:hypothetical protein n=1 Tax=Nocardia inohanensis TaxID=209246 RepID=UPI000829D2D3|nr:hypothetical protein [Nocardia inohanensis]
MHGYDLRWLWVTMALVTTCGLLMAGCVAMNVIDRLDKDLSTAEARRQMERSHIHIPESFRLINMRRFGCPALAGACGYRGSFVASAENFPELRNPFTDATHHRPLQKVTCPELRERVDFMPTGKKSDDDWNFDCAGAIELFASTPYDTPAGVTGTVHSYPEITIARDSQFATLYFYSSPS